MSLSLWRSRGTADAIAADARADRSLGRKDSAQDFVRRHRIECNRVLTGTVNQRRDFAGTLFHVITDTRNLKHSIDAIAAKGAVVYEDDPDVKQLDEQERWDLARALRILLLSGEYRPNKPRKRKISKGGDRGQRTISVYNEIDRIVQRAILQIVQPLIDPTFCELSMGYRPGIGRNQAMATFVANMSNGEMNFVVAEDLKDAFDHVPRNRLWDVLRNILPDEVVNLIETATNASGNTKKGLPQGGNLGPFLLNVYLNHFLDQRWKHRQSATPMIRVADDLLVTCRTKAEAEEVWRELNRLVTNAGMKLKCGRDNAIRHIANGESAEWLGYRLQGAGNGEVRITIADSGWEKLKLNLEECWTKDAPTQYASECILGGLSQLGPCIKWQSAETVYEGIRNCAHQCGFFEIPSLRSVRSQYERANSLWEDDFSDAKSAMTCEDSADSVERRTANFTDTDGDAARGQTQQNCVLSAAEIQYDLYTDGSCLQRSSVGGWAFISRLRGASDDLEESNGVNDTTNNRMELTAVIEGLKSIPVGTRVTLYSDSNYVLEGIRDHLSEWKANRWRRNRGRLKNRDLWKALDAELSRRTVSTKWVRGHNGHLENERCDELARDAAVRLANELNETEATRIYQR